MRNRIRKYLSVLLILSLLLGVLSSTQVAEAKTKTSTSKVTKGQVCEVVNSLLGATVESQDMGGIVNYKKSDKYYSTMSIAYNAGYIIKYKNGKLDKASEKATYNYVATIFSRILGSPIKEVLGKHDAGDYLTMEELKAYVAEIIPNTIKKNVSKKTYNGNTIISKPNIKLSNVTVKGNLIIGDGVADQEVTLDNVTVTGKLIVRGGGENSVIIIGSSNISSVIVQQVNNTVSIKVSNDANVQLVYINDGCNDVILQGPFGSVNVVGSDINVTTDGASINDLVLTGANTSLNVSEGSTITNVTLDKKAGNAKVNVAGTVTNVVAQAPNSSVSVEGTGFVDSITATNSATGIEISVSAGATVSSVQSDAKETSIVGEGKVETAVLNGENSEVTTKGTQITTGKGVTLKDSDGSASPTPVPTSAPSAGNGGGSPTPSDPTPSNPTPTPTPEPNKYITDERFDTGYPRVKLGSENGSSNNVILSIKLKEGVASKEAPATVYYVVSIMNYAWDADSTAIMHGHLGENNTTDQGTIHYDVQANKYGFVEVTDSSVIEIPLTENSNRGMKVYFVIKTADKISDTPTLVNFTGDTTSGFLDKSGPYIWGVYQSDERDASEGLKERTIRVFVDERVDPVSAARVVSGGAITLSGVDGASITDVNVQSRTDVDTYYREWIDINITYPAGADLDGLQIDYIPYEGAAFTDMANVPNDMAPFSISKNVSYNTTIKEPAPQITSITISDDGKYMNVRVSPRMINMNKVSIKVNGEILNQITYRYSFDYCEFFLYNENGSKAEKYTIEITGNETVLIDAMGKEYSSITIADLIPSEASVVPTSAVLDLSDKKLRVTYSGQNIDKSELLSGCLYLLNVDGVGYRIYGRGEIDYSRSIGQNIVVAFDQNNFDEIDLSTLSGASSIKVSLSPLTTYRSHGFVSGIPRDYSGKPVENFTLDVTVE